MSDDFNSNRGHRLDEAVDRLPKEIQPPADAWDAIGGRLGTAPLAARVTGQADPRMLRRVAMFAAAAVVLIVVLATRESGKSAAPTNSGVQAVAVPPTISSPIVMAERTKRVAVRTPTAGRAVPRAQPSYAQPLQSAMTLARFEAHRTEAVPTAAVEAAQPARVSLESGTESALPLPSDIVPSGRAVVLRPSNPNITIIWFY
jgi:hypothetical protein